MRASLFLIFIPLLIGAFVTDARAAEGSDADTSSVAPPGAAASETISLNYLRQITRSQIAIGLEVASVSSATASAIGAGPRVGFDYGLSDKWSLGANFAFAFEGSSSLGAFLYSGLSGQIHYSILGSSLLSSIRVRNSDGGDIYTSIPSAKRRLSAMVGLEQLFLNGSTSIYPAVGYLLGSTYTFGFMGREVEIDLRYTSLTANNNPLTKIEIGLGLNLTL